MTKSPSIDDEKSALWSDFRRGSRFFMQEGEVYETLKRLATRLREESLDYALIEGMALVAHGHRRSKPSGSGWWGWAIVRRYPARRSPSGTLRRA